MTKSLVIGYGSIGKRHAEVLASLGSDVAVVSRHLQNSDFPLYRDLDAAWRKSDYDYVVVASPTSQHLDSLNELKPYLKPQTVVLMEKPVFDKVPQQPVVEIPNLFVDYILRAHPLLRRVRQIVQGKKLYSCRCACGQYLPTWRPNTDYRKCYSADMHQGGGALLDISHELDYLQIVAGPWTSVTAMGGKVSDLEITSDDHFAVLFQTRECGVCSCYVDYLARRFHRDLYIEYEDGSIHLDFMAGKLTVNSEEFSVRLERNDMFRTMHSELMNFNFAHWPAMAEALQTVALAEAARKCAERKIWIEK